MQEDLGLTFPVFVPVSSSSHITFMALLTHEKGKRSQRSLRPSSEVLKKGELMGLAKVPFRKVRKQHVVLTDRVLYW